MKKKSQKKKTKKKNVLGDRRSFSEKSYTKHIGRNCCLKEIKNTTDKNRCTVDTHLTIHFFLNNFNFHCFVIGMSIRYI